MILARELRDWYKFICKNGWYDPCVKVDEETIFFDVYSSCYVCEINGCNAFQRLRKKCYGSSIFRVYGYFRINIKERYYGRGLNGKAGIPRYSHGWHKDQFLKHRRDGREKFEKKKRDAELQKLIQLFDIRSSVTAMHPQIWKQGCEKYIGLKVKVTPRDGEQSCSKVGRIEYLSRYNWVVVQWEDGVCGAEMMCYLTIINPKTEWEEEMNFASLNRVRLDEQEKNEFEAERKRRRIDSMRKRRMNCSAKKFFQLMECASVLGK